MKREGQWREWKGICKNWYTLFSLPSRNMFQHFSFCSPCSPLLCQLVVLQPHFFSSFYSFRCIQIVSFFSNMFSPSFCSLQEYKQEPRHYKKQRKKQPGRQHFIFPFHLFLCRLKLCKDGTSQFTNLLCSCAYCLCAQPLCYLRCTKNIHCFAQVHEPYAPVPIASVPGIASVMIQPVSQEQPVSKEQPVSQK